MPVKLKLMLNLALELPQNSRTVKTLTPFKIGKMGFYANHHSRAVTLVLRGLF